MKYLLVSVFFIQSAFAAGLDCGELKVSFSYDGGSENALVEFRGEKFIGALNNATFMTKYYELGVDGSLNVLNQQEPCRLRYCPPNLTTTAELELKGQFHEFKCIKN